MDCHRAIIKQGILGRWYLACADDEGLAWSGSDWVPHLQGIPTGDTQVSNFEIEDDAVTYAYGFGFTATIRL